MGPERRLRLAHIAPALSPALVAGRRILVPATVSKYNLCERACIVMGLRFGVRGRVCVEKG